MDFVEVIASLRNVFVYFAMAMCLPSLLLYLSECVAIIRHKQFHNSFYFLFLMRAIADLLYVLDSYYGYRLPTVIGGLILPLYRHLPNWMLALFYFLSIYRSLADNLATCFIQLNRLTAIILPLTHEKIWCRSMPLAALAIFGIPIYFSYDFFKMNVQLAIHENDPNSGNRTTFQIDIPTADPADDARLKSLTYIGALSSVIFLIVCVILNLATFLIYRRRQRAMDWQKQKNGAKEAIERKLLVYAILTFIGHMLIALLMIGIYYFGQMAENMLAYGIINAQYPWIVDFGTVVLPSWLLLWASPTFRQQWAADFVPKWLLKMCGKNKNSTVLVASVKVSHFPSGLSRRNTVATYNDGGILQGRHPLPGINVPARRASSFPPL